MVRIKLGQVGLGSFEDYMPSQLSGGMKNGVAVARALAMDLEILFFDEPSAGLDPIIAAGLDELILNLKKVSTCDGQSWSLLTNCPARFLLPTGWSTLIEGMWSRWEPRKSSWRALIRASVNSLIEGQNLKLLKNSIICRCSPVNVRAPRNDGTGAPGMRIHEKQA